MSVLLAFEEEHGRYPKYREAGRLLGVTLQAVNDHYVALRRKGWLLPGPYVQPTEEALETLLGPRCEHCHRGRVTPGASHLKVVP